MLIDIISFVIHSLLFLAKIFVLVVWNASTCWVLKLLWQSKLDAEDYVIMSLITAFWLTINGLLIYFVIYTFM